MNETVDRLFPGHLLDLRARMDVALADAGYERVGDLFGSRHLSFPRRHPVPVQGQSALQAVGPTARCTGKLHRLPPRTAARAAFLPARRLLAPAAAVARRAVAARVRRQGAARARGRACDARERATHGLHRRMAARVRGLGIRGRKPAGTARRAALPARDQVRVRNRMPARGLATGCARSRGGA